jgi:uncharacterized phiE125 gp8 family phage protein
MQSISRESPPDSLALDVCKDYLRIFDDFQDSVILLMRDAAIRAIENYTRQRFVTATFLQSYSDTANIVLSAFPVVSIDAITVDNVALAPNVVATVSAPWQISPTPLDPPSATPSLFGTKCEITYSAGWVDWPEDLVLLVLEKIGEAFDNRKASGPAVSQQFTRAHTLALEHYCSHHDAIR